MPNKTRPQKLATNAAHLEKLDRLNIRPYKAEGAAIRAAAAAAGQSVTAYVLDAVRERMQRDAAAPTDSAAPAPAPDATPTP